MTSDFISAALDSRFPTDVHWPVSSQLAAAYRSKKQTVDSVVRVFDPHRPDLPSEIGLIGQSSTVRWLPRSSDRLLVGTTVADLFLYDIRTPQKLVS
jgi:hypothetical protein